MKITQYCARCGARMELSFGRFFKRKRCPCCKTKFKYRETKDGVLRYVYKIGKNFYLDEQAILQMENQRAEVLGLGTVRR